MLQHNLNNKFRVFINLNGFGADNLSVQNFWGECSAARYSNIRTGKTYRKIGLYNEILDAFPTYYSIELPELFDKDHIVVLRTTVLEVTVEDDTTELAELPDWGSAHNKNNNPTEVISLDDDDYGKY